ILIAGCVSRNARSRRSSRIVSLRQSAGLSSTANLLRLGPILRARNRILLMPTNGRTCRTSTTIFSAPILAGPDQGAMPGGDRVASLLWDGTPDLLAFDWLFGVF